MKRTLPILVLAFLISCARMGENTRTPPEQKDLPTQAKSQTRDDAERIAREKAASECKARGYKGFIEIEMHTTGRGKNGRECSTVSVPCPKAQKNADPSKSGKPCLEYQCSDRSVEWESHLLFECK